MIIVKHIRAYAVTDAIHFLVFVATTATHIHAFARVQRATAFRADVVLSTKHILANVRKEDSFH